MRKSRLQFCVIVLLFSLLIVSCTTEISKRNPSEMLRFSASGEAVALFTKKGNPPIVLDPNEFSGVKKVASMFQADFERVSGNKPEINEQLPSAETIILVGTIGKNKWIDELVKNGKIDLSDVNGKWETSLIQTVDNPFPNVKQAIVIVGSDKRGTIFGMFDISRKMGVSPWYWWADVPVKKHAEAYVNKGRYNLGEPKIKYRGIFLNDEEPALGRWAVENYGGFNHKFYEKVFELLLRQKANFMWPAMWWASFNSNDSINPQLANELGIVMSTSHHEPMMRAHAEWRPYGGGEWNYATNKEQLQKFWREGIERMGNNESVVTLAMRGDGDKAMSAETNTKLLETIVKDQRQIIEDVTGKPAQETPQVWALYKEVQDYYDDGMRVPDDVTLLLCDDNWGNIRKLPKTDAPPRSGGYGIYYHFDYVGGPRNYKWLNTSPLPRVWEQMNLAYEHGVDRIWLVNVGDLKPMELPISFFLDFAWNPENIPAKKLPKYVENWAAEQFGDEHAKEIGEILRLYPKYNGRRKPESLNEKTFNLTNYSEFEKVTIDYKKLAQRTEALYEQVPAEQKDAFYQLVYHPVVACANLYDMYFNVAQNRLYASQKRTSTNLKAKNVEACFAKDSLLTKYFHTELAEGKWNHMMAQTHIGYTYWQQPPFQVMPAVDRIELPTQGDLKFVVEGAQQVWPQEGKTVRLPVFDSFNKQTHYIEFFNTGKTPKNFLIESVPEFLIFSETKGEIETEKRVNISVDWEKVTANQETSFVIVLDGKKQEVEVQASPVSLKTKQPVFVENNGAVSIEAPHFHVSEEAGSMSWLVIPGLGKTLSAITSSPATVSIKSPAEKTPRLSYNFFLLDKPENEEVTVELVVSPTLDFHKKDLHCAVSIDDGAPVLVNLHNNKSLYAWENGVRNSAFRLTTTLPVHGKGEHRLHYWLVDGGVVLQKLMIDNGGLKESYLGAPESKQYKP